MARVARLKTLIPAPSPNPVIASRLNPAIVLRMPRTTGLTWSLPLNVSWTELLLTPKRAIWSASELVGHLGPDRVDEPHHPHDIRRRGLQVVPRPAGVTGEEQGVGQ